MRWEELREDADESALFDRGEVMAEPERGTGRAGLSTPGPEPVDAGSDEGPMAIEIRARSVLNRVPAASDVPFQWTVNPYRGCSHACVYCFARRSHEYLNLDSGRDFDTKIMVKVNAGRVLRTELADPRWGGHHIAMGTNTDPYQRAEGHYRLMPDILAALRDFANPFSILTKGTLVLRDLPVIEQAAQRAEVGMAVSVGSVDDTVWRSVEPGTPRPTSRLNVVRQFTRRGIGCSVLMAPVLPGLTDSAAQLEETVAAIAEAGASSVTPIVLHLRSGAREWYLSWLSENHPHLVPYYRELYAHGAYAPRAYQKAVQERVREAAHRHGLHGPGESPRAAEHRESQRDGADRGGAEGHQLTLM
ncbi:DNA repair photolyase [Haloactinospora alba]|uniref:DNA repair photolyase n=1 Tax=Haloactinospora alba TaxID=405555 RepID=A0A543N7B2_9ACTN|nr:Rv2578c family radical SAM protein [Haloactinospora alba]TQN27700.1 DNA repair photolyase [Haloactinospora alba]